MGKYIQPAEVGSPKRHWVLVDVLVPGDEGESAVAIGRWNGKPVLGMRWNGKSKSPIGNPQSRGLPTWFIVHRDYAEAILNMAKLAPQKMNMARTFLGLSFRDQKPEEFEAFLDALAAYSHKIPPMRGETFSREMIYKDQE